jgi:hypothetical protein
MDDRAQRRIKARARAEHAARAVRLRDAGDAEPLSAASVNAGKRRVRGGKTRVRHLGSPEIRQPHEIRAAAAEAMQEDDQRGRAHDVASTVNPGMSGPSGTMPFGLSDEIE